MVPLIEIFLPRTDGGVAVQIIATGLVGPTSIYVAIRGRRYELAWFLGGLLSLWLAFIALRTVH